MVIQCKEVTNTNNNANQNENWARFSSWWDSNKCNLDLDAAIFTVPKEQFTTLNAAEMVLEVSHLQRAHILAAYIGKLKPAKQNMTHLQGNSLKNYLDAGASSSLRTGLFTLTTSTILFVKSFLEKSLKSILLIPPSKRKAEFPIPSPICCSKC